MCPFGCTYNSNACHTTNANRVVARFSAKAKKAPGFSMVSLWFLSSLCVCVCVVVFLRETIKKLNRKLASHFVLKGKFNIKGLHCTHGRQGTTHTLVGASLECNECRAKCFQPVYRNYGKQLQQLVCELQQKFA